MVLVLSPLIQRIHFLIKPYLTNPPLGFTSSTWDASPILRIFCCTRFSYGIPSDQPLQLSTWFLLASMVLLNRHADLYCFFAALPYWILTPNLLTGPWNPLPLVTAIVSTCSPSENESAGLISFPNYSLGKFKFIFNGFTANSTFNYFWFFLWNTCESWFRVYKHPISTTSSSFSFNSSIFASASFSWAG